MKILFSILVLLTFEVKAQDLSGAVNVLSTGVTPADANHCSEADYQNCTQSLCGPPIKLSVDRTTEQLLKRYNADRFGKISDVEVTLKKTLSDYLASSKKFITALDTPEARILADQELNSLDAREWSDKAADLFGDFVETEVDPAKPINARISVKVFPPENSSPEFLAGLQSYVAGLKANFFSSPEDLLDFSGSLSPAEVRGGIKTLWEKYGKQISAEKSFFSDNFINVMKNIDQLSDYDLPLEGQNLRVYLDKKIAPREKCLEKSCRDMIRENELKRGIESLKNVFLNPDFVETFLPICVSGYIQQAVRVEEEEKFRATIPEVMAAINQSAMKNFSEHSRSAFNDFIKNVDLNFGQRHDPVKALPIAQDVFRANINIQKPMASLSSFKSSGSLDVLKNVPACRPPTSFDTITDEFAASREKSPITISDVSCQHLNRGKKIFAHEVGHALSYAFRNKMLSLSSQVEYEKKRACITGQGTGKFEDDSDFTEEDLADQVAYTAFPADPELQSCILQKVENNSYVKLSIGPAERDVHSGSFTRLLREAVQKKKSSLSPQCFAIYNEYKSQLRLDPCL